MKGLKKSRFLIFAYRHIYGFYVL